MLVCQGTKERQARIEVQADCSSESCDVYSATTITPWTIHLIRRAGEDETLAFSASEHGNQNQPSLPCDATGDPSNT